MKAKLVSGNHSRVENGSRVRYSAGDIIKNLTKKEYDNFSFKFEAIDESNENKNQNNYDKPFKELTVDDLIFKRGGWYIMPDGEKVQGEESAQKYLEDLKAK